MPRPVRIAATGHGIQEQIVSSDQGSNAPGEAFAAQLQRLMEMRGLQQRQLARRAHLSESSISRLLSGEQGNPTTRTLQHLARALDLEVRDLLLSEGEAPRAPASESEELLLELYRLLSPEERSRIVGYAEAIVEQRRRRRAGGENAGMQWSTHL
jgi:transcriptional regulator with XRE-family HTH domain